MDCGNPLQRTGVRPLPLRVPGGYSRWMIRFTARAAVLLFPLCCVPALTWAASPHPCATVEDDAERLACYDRTFGTPEAPVPLPDPPGEDAANAAKSPEKFTAVVAKVEWRNGVFIATLDNGQVWMQSERDSRVQIAAQDTVTIRRASLGSHLLTGKQGIAARVKRLR